MSVILEKTKEHLIIMKEIRISFENLSGLEINEAKKLVLIEISIFNTNLPYIICLVPIAKRQNAFYTTCES